MTQIGLIASWEEGNITFFQLKNLFRQYGGLDLYMRNPLNGNGGRYFVTFNSYEEAELAKQKTNGTEIGQSVLTVEV